ncbi:hypothetical protein E3P89_00775 [Wallemia ichthyophaga]|uniref:Inosine triphosphate pyrophosphatase n=1 Tax=Wallemia ichthyophaga TaxID=245174 RepID=A0A4T0GM15_WALIC|nr:hypothetical protein E3P95_01163 [Wallemia ichthyophaga]TIB02523.1 hypothetical protein E3P96_02114 [Wallemia ichthyophaga]TIB02779.1 hypothetical protein E3P94_01295 [Wallemia ichthyophaga]TIB12667.1 hypothetical protein E3P93_02201 [Wallemia ichthyophaga]TIB14871.1 hypothetical protein E3P90_01070 [Wallemia ichthyophaga]
MKEISFITSNKNKLLEVSQILCNSVPLINKDLDLPEYQGASVEEIATQKCITARNHVQGPVLIEDTALCFDGLNNLPGPYIKWFLGSLGLNGLNTLLHGFNNNKAHAVCTFAYSPDSNTDPVIFQGKTYGNIVQPRGDTAFGWDPIFQPDEGGGKTYAEMTKEDKNKINLQYDFINGSLAVEKANEIIPTIQKLIKRGDWRAVIDCHPPKHISFASTHNKQPFSTIALNGTQQDLWPDHCIVGSRGCLLHSAIQDTLSSSQLNIHYVDKGCEVDRDAYSAFQASSHDVKGLVEASTTESIYVCGLAGDYCVKATAISAAQLTQYPVTVIEDATASVDKHSGWKRELEMGGVKILTSNQISKEMAKESTK